VRQLHGRAGCLCYAGMPRVRTCAGTPSWGSQGRSLYAGEETTWHRSRSTTQVRCSQTWWSRRWADGLPDAGHGPLADLWALGVLMVEMASGTSPFAGGDEVRCRGLIRGCSSLSVSLRDVSVAGWSGRGVDR
jgi:serine/threonine protein kinase